MKEVLAVIAMLAGLSILFDLPASIDTKNSLNGGLSKCAECARVCPFPFKRDWP